MHYEKFVSKVTNGSCLPFSLALSAVLSIASLALSTALLLGPLSASLSVVLPLSAVLSGRLLAFALLREVASQPGFILIPLCAVTFSN